MLTREQYFPGHAPGEQVALFIRRHWMAFFPWIVFGSTLALLVIAVAFALWLPANSFIRQSNEAQVVTLVIVAMLLLSLAFALLRAWMSYYLDVTIVTERRLVDINQKGIFVRRIAEQSLLRVQDVSARQRGFWNHFFNYGDLYIETAGQQQNFEIRNIPRPNEVAKIILDLHDRLVSAGGHELEELEAEGDFEPHVAASGPAVRPRPKHPLEELRPYFPEPGMVHSRRAGDQSPPPAEENHSFSRSRGDLSVDQIEGELHEGETVTVGPKQTRS